MLSTVFVKLSFDRFALSRKKKKKKEKKNNNITYLAKMVPLRVNNCCCVSLRYGGLAIGWLGLVVFAIIIVITAKWIILFDPHEIPDNITDSDTYSPSKTLDGEIIRLIIYIFDAFVSGMLIFGIIKEKPYMLTPWLLLRGCGLLLLIPGSIIVFILALMTAKLDAIIVTFITLLFTGLFIWLWIIIYSLFQEIRDKVENRPVQIVQLPTPMPTPVPYYATNPDPTTSTSVTSVTSASTSTSATVTYRQCDKSN
ncbi:uncharacterized protein LOC129921117 [Episyrphus balteatus]|uniref:uncharacterized protein LOC129921117 n=1 Tax=Episyrphus balteatus TaxID=286459 RepID=UPI0024863024|nr:uncharacterized protein LOC129921117 [Episyrphus balteatus]